MPLTDEIKKGIACDSVGKPDSAIGRAVCLSVHPGKMLLFPLLHWYRYHYAGRYRFARAVFTLDLVLITLMLTLAAVALYAHVFRPSAFTDRITFDASIAPREVTTGASATIVIRYTNATDEELRNVHVSVTEPRYFHRQTFEGGGDIGTIPPGGSGNIHLKGVMFGDVGGEQTFQTKMAFTYGKDEDIAGEKSDWQVFSPTRSALSLTLELPNRLVPFQPMEGVVRFHNTSEVAFPVVSILPEWPAGFTFTASDARYRNGQFEIPSVDPGETGSLRFTGVLQEAVPQALFVFHPSFTFGDDRFRQETLTHTAPVVPLPVELTHAFDTNTLTPGTTTRAIVRYKQIGDTPVSDVSLTLSSESPFFIAPRAVALGGLKPGEEGEVEMEVALRPSLLQTHTDTYEHLRLATRASATYLLGDGSGQRVASQGPAMTLPVTTPVRLEAFARYRTPSGDQIGRGPLPPEPGRETTYWVFWNIAGTTNELKHVRLEATLPEGVRFTGRQTVSQGDGVQFDERERTITWTADEIPPTLAPQSKIVGAAFELGITPPHAPTSSPPILTDILLTATDGFTGAFVSKRAPDLNALVNP
ncbi:hypothetical protein FJZ23_01950 [Candidatus Parcubacteria bacterium]|nr:hypothetical protein [Candidatus Parcubacteria bacterium]